ncbi:MAG: glycosyltransferase [Elusimicrobia bacterium]|nr:glycosyltransferase [Elusimicrobiota bacterium]
MNNLDNKISVIVPCYNSEKTIHQCLESFLAQDIKLKEIIVVDDCSKDDTLKVVEKIKEESNIPIVIVKNSKNLGEGGARNAGAWAAAGEYIIQTDSDAKYSRNYCRKIIEAIMKHPKTISFGGLRICWTMKDNIWKGFWDTYFIARWKLLKENKVPRLGGWAFRREDFIKFGGYREIRQGEDVDLVNRMKAEGYSNLWVPNVNLEHVESQTFKNVFKRFSRSKERILLLQQNGQLLKTFIVSFIYMALSFSGILILTAPAMIFLIPEGRISIGYLIRKRNFVSLLLFPWLYFYFKFSSAYGIFIGTIQCFPKIVKQYIRTKQSTIYFGLNENYYKKIAKKQSENNYIPVLISMDDFCPLLGGDEKEWEKLSDGSWANKNLIKLLEKDVKVTLFTVPSMFNKGKNWSITDFPDWIKLIKSYGDKIEIACHGYDHYNPKSKTQMKEFDNTDYELTREKMSKALAIFKQAGFEVKGIRPPGWGLGKNNCLIEVSKELGLHYGSFASLNDGLNRYIKRVSNIYAMEFNGILNIPQNIGVNDKNIENTIKTIVDAGGNISIKMHYGDYAANPNFRMSDNFDKLAIVNLFEILKKIQHYVFSKSYEIRFTSYVK